MAYPSEPARSAATPALRVEGLTKRFPVTRNWPELLRHPTRVDYATALCGVTCEVDHGEFCGLLGPNGAGKTTLLKILTTLILPDAGTARVEGYDVVRDARAVRRVLAPVIADERSLHWRLSAAENLRLFAVLHDVAPAALERRVAEVLDVVGLRDVGRKPVGAFSTGMKQRLLIARALIGRPRVLLLDEPTRSLDPVSARDLRAFLRTEIATKQGCTVLLATHQADEAFELCDRVAILDQGRLVASGAPQALKRRFGNERYRFWTTAPDHAGFAALTARGALRALRATPGDADGWTVIEMDVPGGLPAVSEALAFLVSRGVAVGRCERVELSLADLIERVVAHA